MPETYTRGPFTISTDPARLDLDAIHAFLSGAYWSENIPREIVARSLAHSLCFGVYDGNWQIGLTRVITDYATYAYLGGVYILEEYRGRGLAKWLMRTIMAHPDVQGLRSWSLATRNAHGLYAQFGFTDAEPGRHMVRRAFTGYTRHPNPARRCAKQLTARHRDGIVRTVTAPCPSRRASPARRGSTGGATPPGASTLPHPLTLRPA